MVLTGSIITHLFPYRLRLNALSVEVISFSFVIASEAPQSTSMVWVGDCFVPRSDMLRPLHDPDLVFGQAIELIDQVVDLGVG